MRYYYIKLALERISKKKELIGELLASPQDEFTRKEIKEFVKAHEFTDLEFKPDRTEDFIVDLGEDGKVVGTRFYYKKSTLIKLCKKSIEEDTQYLSDNVEMTKTALLSNITQAQDNIAEWKEQLETLNALKLED